MSGTSICNLKFERNKMSFAFKEYIFFIGTSTFNNVVCMYNVMRNKDSDVVFHDFYEKGWYFYFMFFFCLAKGYKQRSRTYI